MKFNRSTKLESHLNLHYNRKPFNCDICFRAFTSKKSMNYHKIKHNNPQYRCDKCSKQFYYKDKLKKHEKNCQLMFTCKCGKSFIRKKNYNNHIYKIKKQDFSDNLKIFNVINYKCKYCKKSFKSRKTMFHHISTIHNSSN